MLSKMVGDISAYLRQSEDSYCQQTGSDSERQGEYWAAALQCRGASLVPGVPGVPVSVHYLVQTQPPGWQVLGITVMCNAVCY